MKCSNWRQLNVRNVAQKLILKCEMLGQISDGQWENASPTDHWRSWCEANIVVDPSNVGHNFYAVKGNYNFTNGELLNIVGDRMLFQVKLGLLLHDLGGDELLEAYADHHWQFPEGIEDFRSDARMAQGGDKYWVERFAMMEGMGIDEEVVAEIENWDGYTKKQLMADLRDLKTIFKTQN